MNTKNNKHPDKIGYMWQDRQTGELGSVVYDNPGLVDNHSRLPWRVKVEIRVIEDEGPKEST